jgi:acyl-CoA thioesterase FadM
MTLSMTTPTTLPTTRTKIQARYSDTDAMGHFSSGSYITVDILRECRYGDLLEVVSWCSTIGHKSLTISSELYANGQLVAKGAVTNVGVDVLTRKSAPLLESWK